MEEPVAQCPTVHPLKSFDMNRVCILKRYLLGFIIETFFFLKFVGTWFEIERIPEQFQKNVKCVRADYTLIANFAMKVSHSGINMLVN
jgi:hypothetical protein